MRDNKILSWSESIGKLSILYSMQMKEFNIPLEHSEDTLTSGWLCVMFFFSFLRFYPKTDIPVIFSRTTSFVALYLLVDHYIDSPDTTKEDKKLLLKWLPNFHLDPPDEKWKILLPHLDVLGKEHLPELVEMVVRSYQAQISELNTKQYLEECKKKGAITTIIGTKMIFGSLPDILSEEDLERLGYCAQLLDDITDCSDDLANEINTACTREVKKRGNLDRIAWELLYELTLLPEELKGHKIGFQWISVYVCGRTQHTSKLLRKLLGLGMKKEKRSCLRDKIEEALRKAYDD